MVIEGLISEDFCARSRIRFLTRLRWGDPAEPGAKISGVDRIEETISGAMAEHLARPAHVLVADHAELGGYRLNPGTKSPPCHGEA